MLPDESIAMPAEVLVEVARGAEELGFAGAWLPDHVLPPGEYGATFGGVYEPLVTIGYLAAVTRRLWFGTSVLVAPLRDPFVLAKQAATLHRLSGGRFVLGVGVGWSEEEFAAVGADHGRRGEITDDVLALLHHLFGGGTAPYRARRFSYETGVFAPVPDGRVPVMVGGNSDAALRRAARYADVWQGVPADPGAFAERARRLTELAAGRDVRAALRIAWNGTEPAESVADRVRAYRDAGASEIAVHFGPHEGTRARMESLTTALTDH